MCICNKIKLNKYNQNSLNNGMKILYSLKVLYCTLKVFFNKKFKMCNMLCVDVFHIKIDWIKQTF